MDKKSVPVSIGNKRVKGKLEGFLNIIEEHRHKRFYVCSHDNPDPDSIASAWGVAHILEFLGIAEPQIIYRGDVSHPQNRAMINVLNIPLRKWSDEIKGEADTAFIFVDCVGNQKNMTIPSDPLVVIDHHKATAPKGVFSIHDEIGSCSTLVTDLMLSVPPRNTVPDSDEEGTELYCFDSEAEDFRELATALALGIKTDTIDFRSETTTDDDIKAYRLLCRQISDDKFSKIVNYELPEYMFDAEQLAWSNRVQDTPNLISGLGFVDEGHSDSIPYLADKMMRLRGIQTVVVYGIVGNSVRASVRTSSSSLDCDNLCKEIFGEKNGGAKQGVGGAIVSFNVFDIEQMPENDKKELWELTKTEFERRFRKATEK